MGLEAVSSAGLDAAAGKGIESLFGISPLTTALVLVIMGLCWFINRLLNDLKSERADNLQAYKENTVILTKLETMFTLAINK